VPPTRRRAAPPPSARRTSAGTRTVASRPTAIVSLQDPSHISYNKWWFYGASGIGKTVLIGGMPTPALIVTTDVEGTASAKAFGSQCQELQVNTWQEYTAFHAWYVHEGFNEFPWLSLDTVDELEEICWQAQLVGSDVRRASKYQPNKADYPIVWRKVKEHVMELNRTKANIIYSSHAMYIDRETEEEETVSQASPLVGSTKRGDLSVYMCSQMGLVGYYRPTRDEDNEEHRALMTRGTERWIAKDRYNAFGKGILDPTIPGMLAKIAAAGSVATATPRRRVRRGSVEG
jgi:hypothetical protein